MAVLPTVKQDIPVIVLFRALGCISDRDIMEHVSLDLEDYELLDLLKPSIEEAFPIQSQDVALNFIGTRALQPGVVREKRIEYAKNLLERQFLPHIGTCEDSFRRKIFFLGYMVNRLLCVALGRREMSDKDHYGNKRMDLVGPLFNSLFRQLFRKSRQEIHAYILNRLNKNLPFDINLAVRSRTITDGLRYALGTGNWGDARNGGAARSGVSQVGFQG